MLKKFIYLFVLLVLATNSHAQFYKSVLPSAEFNKALEKIIRDFKYNFKHISGAALVNEAEYDTYESVVVLPGASNCTINQYRSVRDTTASWQGVLYQGDDYNEAVKAYRNAFRLMNKSRIQLVDKTYTGFRGRYEEPTEDIRFALSTLRLDIEDPRYRRFTAELEFLTNYSGWQVNVNFFSKKPDDARE